MRYGYRLTHPTAGMFGAREKNWAYCIVGGTFRSSVVHFSGLYWLARALATGEATVILQAFQHNSFASEPARE